METLLHDIRYGFRVLRKSPGFTVVAVITLALGIGANSTMFSTVNAMLLRPFPFPNLDRVVALWDSVPKHDDDQLNVSPANFLDWKEQSKGFDQIAATRSWDVNLTGAGVAQRIEAYQVTANFFSLLGVSPHLGRAIGTTDFAHGTAPVVVFSYGFWQRHLGADLGIIGKNLSLNGQKFTVAGIMGKDFDFPMGAEAWTPLDLSGAAGANRADGSLVVMGRLKDGVSAAQAQADMRAIATHLAQQYPSTNADHEVRVVGLVDDLMSGSRQFILVLMGAAIFVLLLACANVANLQLARASSRQKEIALRVGLGASRWQIARQLLVESVLVAMLGGVAGLLLARWGLEISRRSLPPFVVEHIAGLKHLQLDSRVLVFTLAVSVLTGIIAGLAPALHVSRPDINDVLKEGARGTGSSVGRRRLRTLLVISEIALALVLLVGAGLMVRGFRNLLNIEMGFDRSHVLTFHVALQEEKYRDPTRVRGFYDQVIRNLQALPDVQSAACLTSLPSGWSWNWREYSPEGKPPTSLGEMPTAISQIVSPGFFGVLRVRLMRGRFLSADDGPDATPAVVISKTLAQSGWPGQDPIGKHIRMGRPDSNEPWRTIVGIVGEVKPSPFLNDPAPTAYVPFAQMPQAASALVVRTPGDPLALAASANAAVQSVDPDQPAYDVRTLEQVVSDNVSGVEFSARMMLVFGFAALILAAAGIFAVMAYSVTQRTHEIGVRMALGARQADVLRLVVGYAIKMAAVGLAIGLGCGLALTHALSSLLFGVIRIDVATFASLTLLLAAVATLAAYIPARWAARVDPMVALRYE